MCVRACVRARARARVHTHTHTHIHTHKHQEIAILYRETPSLPPAKSKERALSNNKHVSSSTSTLHPARDHPARDHQESKEGSKGGASAERDSEKYFDALPASVIVEEGPDMDNKGPKKRV